MNKINPISIIKIYFFNFFLKKPDLKLNDLELNFQNLIFEDLHKLKNIYSKIITKIDSHSLFKEYYYQSFDWLIISKKIGGVENIIKSKDNIIKWIEKKYSLFSNNWKTDIAAKRLINLIYFYDFYSQTLNEKEKKLINNCIFKHFLFVNKLLKINNFEESSINIIKASLLAKLILKENLDKINTLIDSYLNYTIDHNGFHKSYNPSYQVEFINFLYEIKNIYLYFDIKIPKVIDFQLINLTSVLNNLFHKDGSMCLFNGSNNFNQKSFNYILNQLEDVRTKELINVKNGIAVYNDVNKKIFFDIVKPINKNINKQLHASTLSFEFSSNKEKIITNCGSLENRSGENPEYLRYSAAHSTIIINNTNISELVNKSSYKRIPKIITYITEEESLNYTLDASHDGYLDNFGKIIKRKIIVSKNSNKISGLDTILSVKKNTNKNLSFTIRFHLTPACKCVLTNNKKSVLIKTQLNNSWIFKFKNVVRIEESIFINDGKKVEQNKQIVLSGIIKEMKRLEEWSLEEI